MAIPFGDSVFADADDTGALSQSPSSDFSADVDAVSSSFFAEAAAALVESVSAIDHILLFRGDSAFVSPDCKESFLFSSLLLDSLERSKQKRKKRTLQFLCYTAISKEKL